MRDRIKQLDGLRGYCVLAVFLSHAFKIRMLWIGVDIFFILSGFLITGILLDADKSSFRTYIGHFYSRRARRILPPYLMLMVLFTIFFSHDWIHYGQYFLGFTNYLQYHKSMLDDPLIPLWSLGVEEQFYLVWPLIIFFASGRSVRRTAIAIILITPVIRGAITPWVHHQPWNDWHWFVYKSTITRMDELAIGAVITFAWRSHSEWIKRNGYRFFALTLLTPVVMLVLARHNGFSTLDDTVKSNVVTYAIAAAASLGAFMWALGGRYIYTLNSAVMRYLGRISYTFYLMHAFFLAVFELHFHNVYAIGGAAFVATLGFASLSWHFMEKPILHGGNRADAQRELQAAKHPTP